MGAIAALIRAMSKAIQAIIGRGRVTVSDDSGNVQLLQVKLNANHIVDGLPRVAEYGFTSRPPVGSDVVAVFISGDRANGVVVGTNHQPSRLKNLQTGEAALYDDQGQSICITRAGIVINGAGLPVTITNTPKVRMETDLEVTGQIKDNCDSNPHTIADMRSIFNGHTQPDPQGGTVGAPNEQM